MRYLFLRGQIPQDRSPREIMWQDWDSVTDMWTILFRELVGPEDTGIVLYWGGKWNHSYADNFRVVWVNDLKKYSDPADVIISRGGFKEYVPLLKRYPEAKKVYYGANHKTFPKDGIKYDVVLVDSPAQQFRGDILGYNTQLFVKPAAPIFNISSQNKKYDCCFVAIHPKDPRKNVKWIYKTVPKDLTILQLGNAPDFKMPGNVVVKRIKHDKMPKAMNKCRVFIAPYTDKDGSPRVISEAMACNLQVIRLSSVQCWDDEYDGKIATKNEFWGKVRAAVYYQIHYDRDTTVREWYEKHLCAGVAGKHLKKLIYEC